MKICDCNGFDLPREVNSSAEIKEEEPCYFSEKVPEFPGGPSKLNNFFCSNSSYEILKNESIDSEYEKVFVCLMIDKSGSIIEKKIRTHNELYKTDVLRIISIMPKWIPAMQSKRPVIGRYTFEIKYKK
jgi:protein TonB